MIPTDADFDDMHHALGRIARPDDIPYRNHFCCEAGGAQAARFEVLSGLWARSRYINAGRDVIYCVTEEGRRKVMAWVAERQRVAGLRHWAVTTRMGGASVVLAKSASAARYALFLLVGDCYPDGFGSFVRNVVSVRAA